MMREGAIQRKVDFSSLRIVAQYVISSAAYDARRRHPTQG